MNPGEITPVIPLYEKHQHGYASSGESESRQFGGGSGKKRASRAGTRSVTTLSAAQLERKRANDREAQRAIRQRTKDHIDGLERNISDLRASQEASEKALLVTQQRNRELEEENTYLRTKLGEAGYPVNIRPSEDNRSSNLGGLPGPTPSVSSSSVNIPRPDPTATLRNDLSLNTSQPAVTQHGPWQQTPNSYPPSAATSTPTLSTASSVPLGPNLSTWRSHDSSASVHSAPVQLQDHSQNQPPVPFSAPSSSVPWSGSTQPYSYQEPERGPQFQPPPQAQQQYPPAPISSYTSATTSPQPHQQFVPAAVPNYPPTTTPQQVVYHPSPPPPQAEFQGMTVSSPVGYQTAPQQNYAPPAPYQMTPMQVSSAQSHPGYPPQQGHMPPPPIPPAAYQPPPPPAPNEQYSQQQAQSNMSYRENPASRGYSLTHYPSG